MESRGSLRLRPGGGGIITSQHDAYRKVAEGTSGLVLVVALVVYPALAPSSLRGLFVFLGVIGAGVLVVAVVVASPGLVGLGLLILFSEYSASLITDEQIDWSAPVYAAALLVLGEVVYSLASRQLSTGTERRRTLAVVGLAVLSGFAVLGMVAVPLPHGALIRALGAGGAAALVLGLGRLARARG